MKIDRTNYEIWFTDWIDNNLTQSQAEDLNIFLKENPDLREEFNQILFMKLEPSVIPFTDKERLKKTIAEISNEQFEFLCVASLENDLSPEQQNELTGIITNDKEKSRVFGLISKTKLSPPDLKYEFRKSLLRRSPTERIIQFSILVLSTAAVIAAFLLVGPARPTDQPEEIRNIAVSSPGNTIIISKRTSVKPDEKNNPAGLDEESIAEPAGRSNAGTYQDNEETAAVSNDSLLMKREAHEIIPKVAVRATVVLNSEPLPGLIAASSQSIPSLPVENEGSKIGKFIAKNFRNKIMKENVHDDTPLKSYEIAEAGISGINKLFGWEMALSRNNDENGDVKSVYFSSKMLKFNVPVKKSTSSR